MPAFVTKEAPDFTATAVVHEEFKTVKLSDYRGKYVVLYSWGTRIEATLADTSGMNAAYEEFGHDDRVVFLGMNYDSKPETARKVIDERHLKFPQLLL